MIEQIKQALEVKSAINRDWLRYLIGEVERKDGEMDGLMQIIEDKAPYSAQQYWEWLLGRDRSNLVRQVEELRKALEWYSRPEHYEMCDGIFPVVPVMDDNGDRAHQALEKVKP